ncbi:MAG: hypothetical protein ACKO85_00890 [Isosphaeraceae bacterium]
MPIELTELQQKTLDTSKEVPLKVIDPRTSASYVLVPAQEYAIICDVLDDEHKQQSIHRLALKNAVGRMDDEP